MPVPRTVLLTPSVILRPVPLSRYLAKSYPCHTSENAFRQVLSLPPFRAPLGCGSNLLHGFQKRLRPSRSDGGSCEKGAPSSGEKIVSSVVRGRRGRCAGPAFELLNEHSVFAGRYRVVRWHGKERSSRLRPLNVRQRVSRFAAPRIGPLAHDHHLQIVGEPRLAHDDDHLFISDLSRGNSARQARSLRADSRNRLRAEIFFFKIAGGDFLLLASRHFFLDGALRRSLHPAKWTAHFLRSFGFRVQYEAFVRDRIVDYHERFRLSGSRQRTKSRQRHLLAKSSLAVAEKVHLRLSRNVIPVRKSLFRFLNGYRAERRAGHYLAAVQSFKSQQFNALAHLHEYAGLSSVHHNGSAWGRRWTLLRPQGSSGSCQRSSEKQVCEYSAIHYFVSSSLPNCCELFAMAIAASPFFSCAIHVITSPSRFFRSVSAARFTFFQKAAAPICVLLPEARRKRLAPTDIYCGSRTACGNPSSPTSKSTWIHSLARSSLTGKPSAPSAPRCMRTRRMAASSTSTARVPGRNVKPLNSLSATIISELAAPAESCGS